MTKAKSFVTLSTDRSLSLIPLVSERYELIILLEAQMNWMQKRPYQMGISLADDRIRGLFSRIVLDAAFAAHTFVRSFEKDVDLSHKEEMLSARVMRSFEEHDSDWDGTTSFSDADDVCAALIRFIVIRLKREHWELIPYSWEGFSVAWKRYKELNSTDGSEH